MSGMGLPDNIGGKLSRPKVSHREQPRYSGLALDLEPAPSHTSLGLVAGGTFVALAIAAFASGYLLVLGARSSTVSQGKAPSNLPTEATGAPSGTFETDRPKSADP